MSTIRSICVYCGSSAGRHSDYKTTAETLGTSMGEAGIRLVYGGGTRGIMGAVSDSVIRAGGQVTGIIPRFLIDIRNTGMFTVLFIAGCLVIGLGLAILLDQKVKGEALFRGIFLFPMSISFIAGFSPSHRIELTTTAT